MTATSKNNQLCTPNLWYPLSTQHYWQHGYIEYKVNPLNNNSYSSKWHKNWELVSKTHLALTVMNFDLIVESPRFPVNSHYMSRKQLTFAMVEAFMRVLAANVKPPWTERRYAGNSPHTRSNLLIIDCLPVYLIGKTKSYLSWTDQFYNILELAYNQNNYKFLNKNQIFRKKVSLHKWIQYFRDGKLLYETTKNCSVRCVEILIATLFKRKA